MAIQTGQHAPDFTLYTDKNEAYTLSEDNDGKSTVLLFFPGAFTSVCTEEMCTVNDDLARYRDLDAHVLGISTDSPFVLAEFKKHNSLDFPLLSDHNAQVSDQYGAKYDHDFTDMNLDRIAKRSAFVIDPDGVVRYAEITEHAGKQPNFGAIRQALEDARG
ncbi:MAG: redoxin domain-containing protein [Bacteroidota bacterium]